MDPLLVRRNGPGESKGAKSIREGLANARFAVRTPRRRPAVQQAPGSELMIRYTLPKAKTQVTPEGWFNGCFRKGSAQQTPARRAAVGRERALQVRLVLRYPATNRQRAGGGDLPVSGTSGTAAANRVHHDGPSPS